MIGGIFHMGSGLGNQLHRYVAMRVLAEEKGYAWGMWNPALFKGKDFMRLDYGGELPGGLPVWNEKKVTENGIDVRSYDPEINFVPDNCMIDGEFQDERYFENRLADVREWLKVDWLDMPDDLCVINFRGGEYAIFPDLFLTQDYWDDAIQMMRRKYPTVRFQVHTDDPALAQQFFPDYECIHDIGLNWRSIRYAKHLIIANSSFAIFPALLNENAKEVIAPRYWARRNTKTWALPQNYYRKFHYT